MQADSRPAERAFRGAQVCRGASQGRGLGGALSQGRGLFWRGRVLGGASGARPKGRGLWAVFEGACLGGGASGRVLGGVALGGVS